MGIRSGLARWLGGTKASVVGLTAAEMADKPLERDFNDATLLSTYRDDAWPYILANKIGEQASKAPLQVGRLTKNGKKEEFQPLGPAHPLQRLFDNPNPLMDGGEFLHTLIVVMELTGHQPIEVTLGRGGLAQELYLHNPGPWRIVPNANATIRGYIYQIDSGDVRWGPQRMTYIRWPNPNDRWYGQGRLAAMRQEVMALEYGALRDKQFEKQFGVPAGILTSEMPIGETTAEELRKRWEKAGAGWRNAGRIAVLGSKTTYQAVQLAGRDAEFGEAMSRRVETLAAGFGVPMPLIRMEGATFSNSKEARAEFWEGTLQTRLDRIARMLTVKLLPLLIPDATIIVRPDYSRVEELGENDKEIAEQGKIWAETGVFSVDEIRQRQGQEPHPDKAIGERLVVPSSLTLKSKEDVTAPPEPLAPVVGTPPAPRPRKDATKGQKPDRDVILAPVRDAYAKDLRAFFKAQGGALLGAVGKAAHKANPDDFRALVEKLTEVILAKRFRDRLARISEGPISQAVLSGAVAAAQELAIEVTFAIPASDRAQALVGGHLERLALGIEQTTVDTVTDLLARGLREQWDNARIRSELSDVFEGFEAWRVDRITRTETAAAYNVGSIGQYRDAGIALVRVVDGDGDDVCAAANGSLWTLEEAEGTPLGHPNCTRTWIPETSDLASSEEPAVTKADEQAVVGLRAAIQALAEPPVVNLPAPLPTPIEVNVDTSGFAAEVAAFREEMVGMRSDVAQAMKPRQRTIIRDKNGRIVGISE